MIEVKIESTGIRAVVQKLIDLEEAGSLKTLAKVMRKSIKKTTVLARDLAPLGPSVEVWGKNKGRFRVAGQLKASIRVAVRKPKRGNIVVEVGTVVRRSWIKDEIEMLDDLGNVTGTIAVKRQADARWRWHWVEFGSKNNRPKAFLRKAWDQTSGAFIPEIREGLEKEVQKILAKKATP